MSDETKSPKDDDEVSAGSPWSDSSSPANEQRAEGAPPALSTEEAKAPVDDKHKRLALSLGRAAAFFIADFMGSDVERAVARLIAEGKLKGDNVVDLSSARRRLRPRPPPRDDDDSGGPGAA